MTDLSVSQLGQYKIIEKLGQGGMASVYKAHQVSMDRIVAVKVLPPVLKLDPDFVSRFRQEARIIASLEHARILPVHDYGEEGDITYLVMRYLEGGTLHQRIVNEGPLSLEEAAHIIRQVAQGLQYAHGKNIIHRDMTSNNVMFDSVGDAYITDFGLAKMVAGSAHLTGHSVVGTPAYVAPEQALGDKPNSRTDIYSLGVVLYEMLVGDVPFHGDTPMAVIFQHVNEPLPDPRDIRSELPESVVNVIALATAKVPDERFDTPMQLADELDRAIKEPGNPIPAPQLSRLSMRSTSAEAAAIRQSQSPKAAHTAPAEGRAKTQAARPTAEPASDGTPGWLIPVLGLVALVLVAILAVILLPGLQQAAGVASPTSQPTATSAVANAPTQQQAAGAASATPGAGNPTSEAIIDPTVTDTGAPPPTQPVAPTEAASIFLSDADTLRCDNGTAVFAVDFGEDEPQEMDIFAGADEFVSLAGDWLEIRPAPPGSDISLRLTPMPDAVHVKAIVAWTEDTGIFILSAGMDQEISLPINLFVGNRGIQIKRGPNPQDDLDVGPPPPGIFDGQGHTVEMTITSDGTVTGLVDGNQLVQGQSTILPGDVQFRAEGAAISLDSLLICDTGG
jgi:serine/threonine protein kinase/type II secretory pathway pseudopilin PulG